MEKIKFLVIAVIAAVYSLTYMASRKETCDTNCQSFDTFKARVMAQYSFVRTGNAQTHEYDTLFFGVDTVGQSSMNWQQFANDLCPIATSAGFGGHVINVVNYLPPRSRLAQTICP